MLLRPYDVYEGGTCDQYLSGFMNQVSQAVDDSVAQEVFLKILFDCVTNIQYPVKTIEANDGKNYEIVDKSPLSRFDQRLGSRFGLLEHATRAR